MPVIYIRFQGNKLEKIADGLSSLGKKRTIAESRALNKVGNKARTRMVRAVTKQTNLKRKTIDKALRKKQASRSNLVFMIRSRGGNIAMKHFKARETRAGAIAYPEGKRVLTQSSWIHGGRFPNRRYLFRRFGDNVMIRLTKKRTPLRLVKSGVYIPENMLEKESERVFHRASEELPEQLLKQIAYLLPK